MVRKGGGKGKAVKMVIDRDNIQDGKEGKGEEKGEGKAEKMVIDKDNIQDGEEKNGRGREGKGREKQ